MDNKLLSIIQMLQELHDEAELPKNVKEKISSTIAILNEDAELSIKASKAIHNLEEIADDANIPPYNRTQIFNLISALEVV